MATLACPRCNGPFECPDSLAGQIVQCPHCQGQVATPQLPPVRVVEQIVPSVSQSQSRERKKRFPIRGWIVGALGVLLFLCCGGPAILGIVLQEKPLPANVTANEWKNASFSQRLGFVRTHSKYFWEDSDERTEQWRRECEVKGLNFDGVYDPPKVKHDLLYYRLTCLDYSDYRLNLSVDDFIPAMTDPQNSSKSAVEVIGMVESAKEEEILAIQLAERAEELPKAEAHEEAMAEYRRREREWDEEQEHQRRESQITMSEYQLIRGTPEDVARILGVEGSESASSPDAKIITYDGSNEVVVSVTFRFDDESREWVYHSKAQSGL